MNHETEKVTLGFWIYLMSDCVLFAGLFATYAVLHNSTFGNIGIHDITNLPYVLIETIALLTSSFTMGLALLFAERNNKNLTLYLLATTLVLGFVFLGMELSEFTHLIKEGSGPSHSAALSSFFALLGTHGLHVLLGSVWMLLVMVHLWFKDLNMSVLRKLTCLALFWHFLDLIWIFIFTFVYLFGSL